MDYYILKLRYKGSDYFIIWFSGETDGVLTENGKVITFKLKNKLHTFASERGIKLLDEGTCYHIKSSLANLNCSDFLNVWNLITDICNSLSIEFWGDSKNSTLEKIYDKLLYGCNLPAITPEGCRYEPVWTVKEKIILARLYRTFIKVLDRSL